MRLKSLLFLLGLTLCILSLVNCSRESSIKENVNLRNNHSVVFVQRAPFENPDAFADSIINLPNPDSVIVSDTVTVTIGDTIHLMGFLRYNANKIYLYQWILDSLVKDTTGKGKDKMKKALVTGHNATPQSWVYAKEGVYSPLFVAVDGNNATDTAGKDQFIRVINTPPYLGVPKDTMWTRAKSPITFPILALDSFGTIKSFKVDLDASGKREAKDWKYTKSELSDSLLITIPYDSTLTDSLGNQKIYIIVTDDDNNTTKDSVYLHFNQLPTIVILGPDDKQRISDTVESFRLFYEGHDKDNEEQLRYYVRVAVTPDNQDADLNLSNVYDLVLKNSPATSFAVIENGENALKKLGFTGRYFSWDVWVTDGYDTVVAEKIKTSKGVRPRYFYLGPSKNTCDFTGTAKFEGLSVHSGIKITLVSIADTNNIYTANTNAKGEFHVSELPAGTFRLTATDETGRGFVKVSTRTPNINAGDEKELPPILLKDPAPPRIFNIKGIEDTISTREFTISGKFSDLGSQVKTAIAVLNNDTCSTKSSNCGEITISKSFAWSVNLSNLADGKYNFKLTAIDSAGYRSDTTLTFTIAATNMSLTVNGASAAMAGKTQELTFTVNVKQADPPINTVYWQYKSKDATTFTTIASTEVKSENVTVKLAFSAFNNAIQYGTRYDMRALSDNGSGSNIVRFGYYDDGPIVTIEKPANDTTITVGDSIYIVTSFLANNENASDETFKTVEWKCFNNGSAVATPCLSGQTSSQKIAWADAGTKRIAIHVENQHSLHAYDTLTVNVIEDPPTISIDDNESTITKKINSKHTLEFTAKDKYGTVKEVAWRCGDKNGDFTAMAIVPAKKQVDSTLTIQLPNSEKSNYKCYVRVKDDDNKVGYDSLVFNVIKDIPTIRLNIQEKTVTIKDNVQLKYTTGNVLGGPITVGFACDTNMNLLKVSNWSSAQIYNPNISGYPTIQVPSKRATFYCVMQAADGENPSLYSLDTATYNVVLAPPTITATKQASGTIKDTLVLYANAQDSASSELPGGIVLYEWGCGSDSASILNNLTPGGATYRAILPGTPSNNYMCLVRVTDDDGLTVAAVTRITVELDPPTVKVSRETGTIRSGFDIILDATARDGKGYIAKREWSCGARASEINGNWKTVSTYDTTWKAPPGSGKFYCVARATDDDGNIATDTMTLTYSNKIPTITVDQEQMHIVQGDQLPLFADINDAWMGVKWYTWQCFYEATNEAVETPRRLVYTPGSRFFDLRDSALTGKGKDVYCVISAQESGTNEIFSDTTHVDIMTIEHDLPVAKITAADTVYPWSGDPAQQGEAIFFYSPLWGGKQSINGTLGDNNLRDYYWQFSNVGGGFFRDSTGSFDTTKVQFHNAFKRPTEETDITICLDFRDSISANAFDGAFLKRHQAPQYCRKVYVRRAWKNIGADTVFYRTTVRTPPTLSTIGSTLTVAYLKTDQVISSQYNTNTDSVELWRPISDINVGKTVSSIEMASNGTDLYMAVLTSDNEIRVYKSAGGTSTWATFGDPITGATSMNIACRTGSSAYTPVVSYAKNQKPYFSHRKNNQWKEVLISDNSVHSAREVNSVFSGEGYLITVFTDRTSQYNTYYATFTPSLSETPAKAATLISKEMSAISLATASNTIYLGFFNRTQDTEKQGPYVMKGTTSGNNITWSAATNLEIGIRTPHIKVAAYGTKAYAIIDDNANGFPHCHAYFLDGTSWKPFGENQLPYFKGTFYNSHNYNLYGYAPEITIASDGMVYISMISWAGPPKTEGEGETPVVPQSLNNGPIFMKNISQNWTINTKP